jgi:hypothetical protein
MEKTRRQPLANPALIVAILALVVALAGTSFAALKLGKNAVKTKNIKNRAVTNAKIADGAITSGKLAPGAVTTGNIAPGAITTGNIAPAAKSTWVQTAQGGFSIIHESGGVTVAPIANGLAVVDFGIDISDRAVSVTPVVGGLGSWTSASFIRCADVGCGGGFGNSSRAIEVATYTGNPPSLTNEGFEANATP